METRQFIDEFIKLRASWREKELKRQQEENRLIEEYSRQIQARAENVQKQKQEKQDAQQQVYNLVI